MSSSYSTDSLSINSILRIVPLVENLVLSEEPTDASVRERWLIQHRKCSEASMHRTIQAPAAESSLPRDGEHVRGPSGDGGRAARKANSKDPFIYPLLSNPLQSFPGLRGIAQQGQRSV